MGLLARIASMGFHFGARYRSAPRTHTPGVCWHYRLLGALHTFGGGFVAPSATALVGFGG
jgi:hypothetical protein